MFLFNSLHQGSNASKSRKASRNHNGFSSLRRHLARGVFALAVMFCLSTAFLFSGCNTEPENVNTHFIPVGEWTDDYGGFYKITKTSIEFDMGGGYGAFTSSVVEANDFTATSGVIIVKIETAPGGSNTVGKYTCVYYKDYTNTHVNLAGPIDESYDPIETTTLAEAKNTFTVDKVDTHVTYWGSGYTK